MEKSRSIFGVIYKNLKDIADALSIDVKLFPKIMVVSSTFVGTILFSYYLIHTKTPLPPVDASFGFTIAVFMIIFSAISLAGILIFFMPILWEIKDSDTLSRLFPTYSIEKNGGNAHKLLPYFLINFSFIIEVLVHYYMFKMGGMGDYIFSLYNFLVFMAALIISSALSYKISVRSLRKVKMIRILKLFFKINAKSVLWMYIFFIAFISYDERYHAAINSYQAGEFKITMGEGEAPKYYLAPLMIITLHMAQSILKIDLKNISIMCLIYAIFFLFLYPGASLLNAYILKLIGAGGGVYAEVYVKSLDGSGKPQIEIYKSCIMFSTSSAIVTKKMKVTGSDPQANSVACDKLSKNSSKDNVYEYRSVETIMFNRSEVQMIKTNHKPGRAFLFGE